MFFSIDIEEDLDTLEIQFDQNNNLKKSENDKIRHNDSFLGFQEVLSM